MDKRNYDDSKLRAFEDLRKSDGFSRTQVTQALRKHGMRAKDCTLAAETLLRSWRSKGFIFYQGHKKGWKFL